MTTISITDEKRLTTLKHLASGKGLDVVATIVGIPRDTVVDIARHHGYPDIQKLAWAADIVEKKIADAATSLPERAPERAPRPAAPTVAPSSPAAGAGTSTPPGSTNGGPLTKPDEIRILLNTAKQHPSKRIQAAADRAFDALDRVRALIREDTEKHAARRQAEAEKIAARAEVERLERQLAEAKVKLRGKPAHATPASSSTADDGPSAAEIRAWATDNNVDCPSHGRVPATVRQAYDDAHQDAA